MKIIQIVNLRKSGKRLQKCHDTLEILYDIREWSSTDSLDRTYGILGLADPSLPNSLVVDYSKSIVEVSVEIARWYLDHGEDLLILNLASSFKNKSSWDVLPSWMPHFGNIDMHWRLETICILFHAGISKSRNIKKTATVIGRSLHVDGSLVDEIANIVPYIDGEQETVEDVCRNILEWEGMCLAASQSLYQDGNVIPDRSDVSEAHLTTILSTLYYEDYEDITPSKSEYNLLKSFWEVFALGEPPPSELGSHWQRFSRDLWIPPQIEELSLLPYGKWSNRHRI